VVYTADGVTKKFGYQVASRDEEEKAKIYPTITIGGKDLISPLSAYEVTGSYPNRSIDFYNAPAAGTKIPNFGVQSL
jgi:hypothetical protein